MLKLGRVLTGLSLYIALLAAGCSNKPEAGHWQGPDAVEPAKIADWSFGEQKARIIESSHYRIHTTITDEEVLSLLPRIMEGAITMYRQIAPQVPASPRPLDCYIFRNRAEWDRWTQRYTGADARIFLQIRSGGYTVHDRYVAYYIGRESTFAVASHEGWHQFAGRHFKGRLPPFLEEGMACMFETVSWTEDRLPRWNLSVNTVRFNSLRKAAESNDLLPLEKLCAMHAGDIVGEANVKIDAFYAQCWAFARFLWEADNARYRPALQKWLAETADGTVYDPTRTHARALAPWSRRAVKPMIEHYLGMDIQAVDGAYQEYMRRLVQEDQPMQARITD